MMSAEISTHIFHDIQPAERRRGRRPKETCGAWWAFANKAKSGENLSKNPEKIFRENLVKIIINIKTRNTLGGYGSKAI